uniref:Uncharacterized protein n=1 Tax=Salix viminalis TaxID=40686 RepID=A0A6N2MY77_SALVM
MNTDMRYYSVLEGSIIEQRLMWKKRRPGMREKSLSESLVCSRQVILGYLTRLSSSCKASLPLKLIAGPMHHTLVDKYDAK